VAVTTQPSRVRSAAYGAPDCCLCTVDREIDIGVVGAGPELLGRPKADRV